MVKSYQVISFLNYWGKVVKKVIAEQLSYFCKINDKLYESQIDTRKFYLAIDTITLLIYKVQEV